MSDPIKSKQDVYNSTLKEMVKTEKCPSCGGNVVTANPKEDDYFDFVDSIYCEKEDTYFSYMAFINMKMEKKK